VRSCSVPLCSDFRDGPSETDYDRQARLSRFTGAAAISSDAYFDRGQGSGGSGGGGGGGSGRMGGSGGGNPGLEDLSAAELVNRLSFHVSRPA
jgi:hypothetical protein